MNQATELKKIQRQRRVDKLVVPNDLLTKTVMHLTDAEFRDYATDKVCEFDEGFKRRQVLTQFYFELQEVAAELPALGEFEFLVLTVCVSAKEAGLNGLTFTEIARLVAGGKPHDTKLRPEQKARIRRAVERLMTTKLHVNLTQLHDTKKYPDMPTGLTSTILPCQIIEGVTVNGQRDCDVVSFLEECPLMKVAKAKKQLLTIPVRLLDVAARNTELVAKVKSYVARRVREAKTSKKKKLPTTILFSCIYRNCGLDEAPRWQRQDARKTVVDTLNHLQTQGEIRGFELTKNSSGCRAVKLQF